MQHPDIKDLLIRYQNGICTEEEKVLIESWYLSEAAKDADAISAENLIQSRDRIAGVVLKHTGINVSMPAIKKKRYLPQLVTAAIVLLCIGIGAFFLLRQAQDTGVVAINDIKPGSKGAILTLGNGQTILLNQSASGQLAVQGGMAVTKTANGMVQYRQLNQSSDEMVQNTITTRRKEQFEVVLADGTKAWLNASSSIRYPSAFRGNDRRVVTTGEVYFEVAHNAAKPFKVMAGAQTVEVLGTHFDINSYTDEPEPKTTLLEGSVKVSAGNNFKIIKPGEQAVLKDEHLFVSAANTEEAVAWKNGYFRFNQEKISVIMRKLSRWYDIDVEYDGPIPEDEFSGTLSQNTSLSEALKALTYYKTVHFKIEGRRVVVSK